MKFLSTLFIAISLLFANASALHAQRYGAPTGKTVQAGVSIGASTFFGDLGGSRGLGAPFIRDLDPPVTRPAIGAYLHYNFTHIMGIRFNAFYTMVSGDDALGGANDPSDLGWSRKYRNLSFKSNIFEVSTTIDINFLPYIPGSDQYPFTIYGTFGIGAFYFNPKALYNGTWVELQPLGTEGQGLPQYPGKKKYSRIALAFPVGMGLKYNFSKDVVFSFEISHRFTTTDYIDDVSTVYPDPAFIYQAYDDNTADLITALADRSDKSYPQATVPGEQRGDPSDFDGYTFAGIFSMSWIISKKGNNQLYCPKLF